MGRSSTPGASTPNRTGLNSERIHADTCRGTGTDIGHVPLTFLTRLQFSARFRHTFCMSEGVKVGTCGFRRETRPGYSKMFPVVEIQHTFYDPPGIKTLEKWRRELPDDFECTLKAWQMITHEASSPTYKRLKRPMTDKQCDEAGFF